MSEMSRTVVSLWDCKCPLELNGEILPVETKCTSISKCYDAEEKEFVVFLGFIERCSKCKKRLGDGYGDPHFFKTEEEAKQFAEKIIVGEWK